MSLPAGTIPTLPGWLYVGWADSFLEQFCHNTNLSLALEFSKHHVFLKCKC